MQSWFLAFAAMTGLLSLLPYRERALLPVPAASEQGFLAREIATQGPEQLVGNAVTGSSDQQGLPGGGARRLIPALVRAAAVPGTTTLADVLNNPAAGTGALPAGAGAGAGTGTDSGGAAGTASLAAGSGSGSGVGPGVGAPGANPAGNPVVGPQGPTVLAGTASQLLAAVVPEPSTWMLFVAGLMLVGYGLRRGVRVEIRRPQIL